MLRKIDYHIIKILKIIRNVHIWLRQDKRHIAVFHLKDLVQIRYVIRTSHHRQDINRDQQSQQDPHRLKPQLLIHHNECYHGKTNHKY